MLLHSLDDTPSTGDKFPRIFSIGGHKTVNGPLVTVEHLKRHLQALGSFHALRDAVENVQDSQLPQIARNMDKAQRWTWFISLAVERYESLGILPPSHLDKDRFERWVQILQVTTVEIFVEKFLPPQDVLMVFHTYLLNPMFVRLPVNLSRNF
jgi:hypothetical protein